MNSKGVPVLFHILFIYKYMCLYVHKDLLGVYGRSDWIVALERSVICSPQQSNSFLHSAVANIFLLGGKQLSWPAEQKGVNLWGSCHVFEITAEMQSLVCHRLSNCCASSLCLLPPLFITAGAEALCVNRAASWLCQPQHLLNHCIIAWICVEQLCNSTVNDFSSRIVNWSYRLEDIHVKQKLLQGLTLGQILLLFAV